MKNQDNSDTRAKFTKGYEDCLQNPLQPCSDNLESQIYEIFEKDPCKYASYQKAIGQALVDKVSDNEKYTKELILVVLGAGRGPLVKCALEAAIENERKIKLYAVEKNKNAINTLLNLKHDVWGEKVDIVASDMRDWKASIKADIVISELLGSFGCNELSPECLYAVQNILKDDGISIPTSYRSFIAPIQSYKLYTEMKKCKEYEFPYEAPYVVLLHNHLRIDEPKCIFEFHHPVKTQLGKIDTNRFTSESFLAKQDCTLHGIAGYFDCNLYKDVVLSIVPETHSEGLFSWFPMFFPIEHPIEIKENDSIKINFWRIASDKKVWYEWCLTEPQCSKIHNSNGRTYAHNL